jgi:Leucine-rich repeat (LRR) protein
MTFVKIILLVFISIIGWSKSVDGTMSQVDCRDNSLSESCICGYDQDSDFLIMECQNPLDGSASRLPDIPARTIMSSNSLMQWPVIPDSYKKRAIVLVLSENRISSIGDLTNLEELKLLNVSFNSIKKIDSRISSLNELVMLDLSGNLIESIDFGDFVPNANKATLGKDEQIFSKLQFLFILGNQIKDINSLDLLFIGMPFINALFLDNNKIRGIDVDLTQQSLNVISKAKQATTQNKTYLKAYVLILNFIFRKNFFLFVKFLDYPRQVNTDFTWASVTT